MLQQQAPSESVKTCRITIVTPGSSDRVIKVHPAQHDSEKIWLDNARGIERWSEVERFLFSFATRGAAIPKPLAYHSSSKDLRTIEITEDDIPTVHLEGAVLQAPPEEKRVDPLEQVKLNPSVENMRLRMNEMERTQNEILSILKSNLAPASAPAPSFISPTPPLAVVSSGVPCQHEGCGKMFKNQNGLRLHGKSHR